MRKEDLMQLRAYFKSFIHINEEDLELICSNYHYLQFKKNDYLTRQGFVENKTYFILDGIIRLHLETENENLTIDLRHKNNYISSFSSMTQRLPSQFNVQAVTDCKVLYITHQQLQHLYSHNLAASNLSRAITEYNFAVMENLSIKRKTLSAKDFYIDLIKKKESFLKEIPLNYVASYLGITPQALSRIRKNLEN